MGEKENQDKTVEVCGKEISGKKFMFRQAG